MPIIATDIKYYLSGGATGAGNTDPAVSLGGVITTSEITTATLHNLFDVVSSAEATAGDTEYRCIYVKNDHGSLTLQNAVVWIQTNTPSSDTTVEIALATEGVNASTETIANESTAPTGEVFSAPASEGAALAIGDIPAGQYQAIWIKRIVSSSAAAYNSDNFVLRVRGDTAA